MKRIGYIFDEMVSCENLLAAHYEAKRGKTLKRRRGIAAFERDLEANIMALHSALTNGTWRMHPYRQIVRFEAGKRREIFYSPFYPDTVVQHAIGRTLGERLIRSFIPDTYAGMTNRGIHYGVRRIRKFLAGCLELQSIYVFKFDLRHYYASIDHDVLKDALRRKIKDRRCLNLLFGIIDSHSPGLPIGNYISPMFANFLLSPYDHWAQEVFRVKKYARYLDDITVVEFSKTRLIEFRQQTEAKMRDLLLTIKPNLQIFPIERYGIDFMGYVFTRNNVRLRKRVERKFRRSANRFKKNPCLRHYRTLASYWGWIKYLSRGYKLWFSIFNKPLKQLMEV